MPRTTAVRRLKPTAAAREGAGHDGCLVHPALLVGSGRYVCAYGAPPSSGDLSMNGLIEA
jgi:hypothetical protein